MKQELLKGRMTSKKIIIWLNEILPEMGMSHIHVMAVKRTYYTQDQYESGACKLHIMYKNTKVCKDSSIYNGIFRSFFQLKSSKIILKWVMKYTSRLIGLVF